MVQVMDNKPSDDTKKKYTWRRLLVDLAEGKLNDLVVLETFAKDFKVEISLDVEDAQEELFQFIQVHVPIDRWDEEAIWPLPPRKVDKLTENEKNLWTAIVVLGVALVIVFMFALLGDNSGPSNQEIRNQARVELYAQLGIQIVDGNVNVLPNGLMATTAKREACKIAAVQSTNLRPDLGLDVAKVLAVCDTIK